MLKKKKKKKVAAAPAPAPATSFIPTLDAIPDLDVPERLLPQNIATILEAFFERYEDGFPWGRYDKSNIEIRFALPLDPGACACGHQRSHHLAEPGAKPGSVKRTRCTFAPLEAPACRCTKFAELYFTGQLDLVADSLLEKGREAIVDWKTTYKIDYRTARRYDLDSQLTGYIWARNQLSKKGTRAVQAAYIGAIELSKLPASSNTCQKHAVPYVECAALHANFQIIGPIERTDAEIEQWQLDMKEIGKRFLHLHRTFPGPRMLSRLPMEGRFKAECVNCEFSRWCRAGRPELPTDAHLHAFNLQRWNPLSHILHTGDEATVAPKNKLFISNSVASDVITCSTKAAARWIWGWTSHSASLPLRAGTAVHTAIEKWLKSEEPGDVIAHFLSTYNTD